MSVPGATYGASAPEASGHYRRYGWAPFLWLTGVAVLAVTWVVLVALHAVPSGPYNGPYPPYWFLFPLGFFGFWLLVALVVRPWGWRGGRARWGYAAYAPDAEEVVRIRYARGEISREEMSRRLRDLDEEARRGSTGALR